MNQGPLIYQGMNQFKLFLNERLLCRKSSNCMEERGSILSWTSLNQSMAPVGHARHLCQMHPFNKRSKDLEGRERTQYQKQFQPRRDKVVEGPD